MPTTVNRYGTDYEETDCQEIVPSTSAYIAKYALEICRHISDSWGRVTIYRYLSIGISPNHGTNVAKILDAKNICCPNTKSLPNTTAPALTLTVTLFSGSVKLPLLLTTLAT